MARYLVTGGAGFIGSHLVDALVASGHAVCVLDDLSTGRRENLPRGVELIVASLAEPAALRRALTGADGCFHLAALASVERAQREWLHSHSVNLSGTIAVFEEASRLQSERGQPLPIVYASSAAVYGNLGEILLAEESATHPINAYGADKLGCEQHAVVAGGLFKVKTVGLRFFNVYGPRQDPKSPYSGVVSIFCERLLRGLEISIHGDGEQVRDFIYVQDVVTALQLAMDSASVAPRVFNVCTGVGTTISQLGKAIARVCGVRFQARHTASRAGDLRASTGDPRRAARNLGFSARVSLQEGLVRTTASMRAGKTRLVETTAQPDTCPDLDKLDVDIQAD